MFYTTHHSHKRNLLAIFISLAITQACTANAVEEVSIQNIASYQTSQATPTGNFPLGLYVNTRTGTLMYQGKPFRGIGVNYFDAFYRNNNTYVAGFAYLHSQKIPFIRFMASPGFWPSDFNQYLTNKTAYFQRMDAFVHNAEINGIGLIPTLFWNAMSVSDVVGEPRDGWANSSSKTIAFMRTYTTEMIERYKNSPAIWGWEFSNEMNSSDVDLLNESANWRPPVSPANGTPTYRTAADDLTTDQVKVAISLFANTVRLYDKNRIILTGNNIVGGNQYHRAMLGQWDHDTISQYGSISAAQNQNPVNTITMHMYPNALNQYFADGSSSTYADIVNTSMAAAAAQKKPLVIEEFGTSDTMGASAAKTNFEQMLASIVAAKVPLASMWVYDFSFQNGTYNTTQTNSRSYQLTDIIKANQAIRSGSGY